jgi:hypothetical protein
VQPLSSRISGSHGGVYEDGCLLGYSALMMEVSKYLRNAGKLLPDYTALLPRRQPSSTVIKFVDLLSVGWKDLIFFKSVLTAYMLSHVIFGKKHIVPIIALGGLVVSMLATGSKVRGFKPGRGRWIFKGPHRLSIILTIFQDVDN